MEKLIWEGVPVSPYDITSKVYKCNDYWYKCKNTGKEFNILTENLFFSTKLPLSIWFEVIFREHLDKRVIPATTVMRDYGLSYKTAWNMLHKIRNAMGKENHQELSGTVEVDEYQAGGSLKNMHYEKKLKVKERPNQNKKILQGFVEREGNLVIRVIPNMIDTTLNSGVLRYVKPGSTLYSDEKPSYQKLPKIYNQGVLTHGKGIYVNKKDTNIYTNNIEGCWSQFKRIESSHIKISPKHVGNYTNGPVFRYNTPMMETGDACTWFLQNIQNTKLTWRQIRDAEYTRYNRNQTRIA